MSSRRLRRARARATAAFTALAVLATAACFGGRLPPLEMYRLSLRDTTIVVAAPLVELSSAGAPRPAIAGTMAVAPYLTPGMYANPAIIFRVGESEYGIYPSREWALPLSDMLGMLTERVLARVPITAEPPLYDPPSRRAYTYIWRGTVREFEEVNRGKQVFAAVHLEARLVRSADDSVFWSGAVRRERLVDEPTMPRIVDALSMLAADAVATLAQDATLALQRRNAALTPDRR